MRKALTGHLASHLVFTKLIPVSSNISCIIIISIT